MEINDVSVINQKVITEVDKPRGHKTAFSTEVVIASILESVSVPLIKGV